MLLAPRGVLSSVIGSPLCDFILVRNVALPAAIRILKEHSTSRMMSAFGAVASVVAPPRDPRFDTPSRRQMVFDSKAKCFALSPPHRFRLGGEMLCE